MNKKLLLLPLVCLCLASCGKSSATSHFKKHLKDPDSYQEISCEERTYTGESEYKGTKIYCIHYRAKNGFGGYNTGTFYSCQKDGEWVCDNCSETPYFLWIISK